MKNLFLFIYLIIGFCAELSAQNFSKYSVQNAHSHNDYHQAVPFWTAYNAGFGSIEADIFLKDGKLLVGHDPHELTDERTLQKLYLDPIASMIKKNGGNVYADRNRKLIQFIEMKSDYQNGLPVLVNLLQKNYPEIIKNPSVKIIITGKVPQPSEFKNYPEFLYFDGDFTKNYTAEQLKRVGMFSSNLELYTKWHGKGIMRDEESAKLKAAVEKAHQMGKPVRFWGAPDFPNAWVNLIDAGADYINTDRIPELTTFLNGIPKNFHKNENTFQAYTPTYRTDGLKKTAKNVILLIADGVSLPQFYAAFTANKSNLNVFKMKNTGLSKTNSANAYITDSAPGSTAFATGVKTKNNFVGVDKDGKYLKQIPEIIAEKGIISGLISTGDVTDATPADFYAHTDNRDDSKVIISDFIKSKVKILAGGTTDGLSEENISEAKKKNISLYNSTSSAEFSKDRVLITDPLASKNYAERGRWLGETFDKTLAKLNQNKNGFFLMAEASRTDGNAHANELGKVIQELLDFDEVVGKALKFADSNGETLVIVLGDHETGGLTLLDGDLKEGWVLGNFSSNDHTALPATVFAYGPNSQDFTGFQENTDIFVKILKAFNIKP